MKKKKGSSLIMVLIIFSIITIIGTSVLSLTLVSYKKRVVDSIEKRNQYFSESGLDVAYGVIGKVIDDGIDNGNNVVETYMDKLSNEIAKEKESFKDGDKSNIKYLNNDGSVNEELIKNEQNTIFRKTYQDYVSKYILDNKLVTEGVKFKETDYTDSEPKVTLVGLNNNEIDSEAKCEEQVKEDSIDILGETSTIKTFFKDIEYKEKKQSVLNLKLQSRFTEKNIEKKINVNYNILTPNYNEAYYVTTNKVELPIMPVWNKAFCVDGDLNILGDFTVDGDIYVKGNDNGGVFINSDGYPVKFKGDLATAGDLQVTKINQATSKLPSEENKKNVTLEKNVYTGNLEIGDTAANIEFKVDGAAYTNNDLALNGLKSNITISNGFYGINDITKRMSIMEDEKSRISSCIRVNSDDIGQGSSINIQNEAILMGTAYIKTLDEKRPFYQTGESVAIKGNYRAYTYPLSSEDAVKKGLDESNVNFDYINPLQLATQYTDKQDGKLKELLTKELSDYFTLYASEYGTNELKLNTGITLPSTISSIGAIFSKDIISSESHFIGDDKKVQEKQRDYANMVYEMGDSTGVGDLSTVYTDGKVKKAVYKLDENGRLDRTVSQIDFESLSNYEISKGLAGDNGEEIIYLNKNNRNYALVAKGGAVPTGVTPIYLDSNGKGRGIIITNGNVYLCGNIDFTGTIISGGNLEVKDDAKKVLKYDPNYVQRLIAYNYDKYFKEVFIGTPISKQYIEVNSEVKSDDDKVGTDIIRDKLIIMEKWKIEK